MSDTNDSDGGSCSTPDSDGEVAEEIGIVSFERKRPVAEEIRAELSDDYERIDILDYHGEVFADNWGDYDCFVGLMASGIAMRKTAGLLDDKWEDPAVVVIDEELTWAIPLTGGHHGANQVAHDLSKLGAVPAMTTASEAAGKQGVESKAKALDSHVVNGDSTVATNLAVLNDELGPVERLDGPRAVLVGDDVTVLKRNSDDGVVLGTGTVDGVRKEQVLDAWEAALGETEHDISDVEFVATATRKEGEAGLYEAAEEIGVGVVCFDKETLLDHEGPSPSRAKELIGWPGIAEASAIAGGRDHELLREKERFDEAVTVAIGK
ncbi:cobalt-precorrin-5A hydrolase [Natronomonas pharaonis DSM 2160]|uniref:Cobalt-precorrin-5A hydrolase n=1 Tax=Natronomonas pharaonis (strain ATCC 35678 / DSM 2160 / CIP 103997 / JCM 8858 / NBRC 14720 / NCIMB 2260 / Gabara) TaxID=348780 RepID=A0A1U7EUJ3_NATPD|nr:cobalt-precorrin 5A hydrolase [Natronomonas pharaonis]CAI48650.1 cobalt-precorrin-5A hydrolase [Natronomonas pharaonis DSM 2160]